MGLFPVRRRDSRNSLHVMQDGVELNLKAAFAHYRGIWEMQTVSIVVRCKMKAGKLETFSDHLPNGECQSEENGCAEQGFLF